MSFHMSTAWKFVHKKHIIFPCLFFSHDAKFSRAMTINKYLQRISKTIPISNLNLPYIFLTRDILKCYHLNHLEFFLSTKTKSLKQKKSECWGNYLLHSTLATACDLIVHSNICVQNLQSV